MPQPDQPFPLETARVKSTIPKAGGKDGETWEYPSQQMFWNAMIRKVSSLHARFSKICYKLNLTTISN